MRYCEGNREQWGILKEWRGKTEVIFRKVRVTLIPSTHLGNGRKQVTGDRWKVVGTVGRTGVWRWVCVFLISAPSLTDSVVVFLCRMRIILILN